MCLYPTFRKNPKYTITKKNGGNVPIPCDNRVLLVPTGCGKCMECRKQKAREWQLRLLEDVRHNKNGKFIALTFSDESIYKLSELPELKKLSGYVLDNAIARVAVRRFLERWRKKYKKSLRHFLITELGHKGTENIHLHGIVWTDEDVEEVVKHWQYGFVWKGYEGRKNYVNEATANYMTKYMTKVDFKHKEYKPKIFVSAGIGKGYTDRLDFERHKYKGEDTIQTYKTRTGHDVALPIYWRNKAFTEDEREKLWLHMLDRNKRYVCGEEVDVSETDADYFGVLEHYRNKNERLGYGDDRKDYEQKRYENELRRLKQLERKQKGYAKLKNKE